ncbi:NAD-dependent epimerase/dehydratase family protein [Streptomyces sp. SS8]
MTVLVTGASGRVGRHVVDELLRRGVAVRAARRGAAPTRRTRPWRRRGSPTPTRPRGTRR